jgi:hypothetical protein
MIVKETEIMKFRVFWDICACCFHHQGDEIIALIMEAARTSETSVNIYLTTWQYIPEDSELHARRRNNLKSHSRNHFPTQH